MRKGIVIFSLLIIPNFALSQQQFFRDSSDILFLSGEKHLLKGEFSLAQKDLINCFKIRKKSGVKDSLYQQVTFKIGELFFQAGKYERASEVLQNHLENVARFKGKSSLDYGRTIEILGLIALENDNYELGQSYLETANAIYERKSGKISLDYARNLTNQGKLYTRQGSFTAAEALFRQARFIFKKLSIDGNSQYSELLLATGNIYFQLHNFIESAEELNEVVQVNSKIYGDKHPFVFRAKYLLGQIYLQSGKIKKAREYIMPSFTGLSKFYGESNLLTIKSKVLIAEYYTSTKRYNSADSLYRIIHDQLRFLQTDKPLFTAEIESSQAFYFYSIAHYDSAIALHQHNLEVIKEFLDNSHPFYVKTINDLSFLYWVSGKKQLSESYFSLSSKNYITQFNRYFAFLSEQEKGYFYYDIRQFFDRYNSYIISRLDAHPSISREMYNHQLANKALLFHTSQEIRSQVLKSNNKDLQGKFYNWIRMKEQLSKLYKIVEEDDSEQNRTLLDSLEEKANFIEKEISLRIELDKKQKDNSIQEITWKEIQKSLAPGEACIEIIRVPEFSPDSGGRFTGAVTYSALILTNHTVKYPGHIIIPNGLEIETKQLRYYRNCVQHLIKDELSFTKFWAPVQNSSYLKDIKKIYISCDGVYNQINLNTLIDPETGKTLFEERDIHLINNTKDILRIKNKENTSESYKTALFGYPDYYKTENLASNNVVKQEHHILHRTRGNHDFKEIMRGGKIVDLPGTKAEIEEISTIISNQDLSNKVYLGSAANEQSLKALDNPNILHIATHGYFMPDIDLEKQSYDNDTTQLTSYTENPLTRSGIMLVGAGFAYSDETLEKEMLAIQNSETFEDGILTAYEAMNINLLNTDMVILSACETGLGEVKNGEGVYGLQRALQTAGAKSVIMSLWKVSDQATKKLMVYFYTEWVKTKDKRASFRIAQEKLRLEFTEPLYWGAFVMTGE